MDIFSSAIASIGNTAFVHDPNIDWLGWFFGAVNL